MSVECYIKKKKKCDTRTKCNLAHLVKSGLISFIESHDDTSAGHLPLLTSLLNAPIITGRQGKRGSQLSQIEPETLFRRRRPPQKRDLRRALHARLRTTWIKRSQSTARPYSETVAVLSIYLLRSAVESA